MPKSPRSTDDPIGQKLLQVLQEKGQADDLNALASAFGVTVQSTYDWIKFGRIAKDRYAKLVEWSGKPLHWWFDIPSPTAQSDYVLTEDLLHAMQQLSPEKRRRAENALRFHLEMELLPNLTPGEPSGEPSTPKPKHTPARKFAA